MVQPIVMRGAVLKPNSSTPRTPPVFNGEGFYIWVVKMRTYLQAFDLWEVINSDVEPAPLRASLTISQVRHHVDERTKRYKAMSCIQNCVSDEQRRASRMDEHQEGVFQAKAKATVSTSAYKGKKNWRSRPKLDATGRGGQLYAVCQHCKKKGHVERVCKEKGKPGQNQAQHKNVKAQVAEDSSDHKEQVFTVSCLTGQSKGPKGWLLDSGCTNHMSPNATIFKTLDRSCKAKVKIGNGQFIKAKGKGDVLICTSTGDKVITNVLLVPEIDRNLLSIAQLLEKGYSVVFKGHECQIADPNRSSLITVTMTDKCFKVNWSSDSYLACVASAEESKLWHQRLSDANFRSMARMVSKEMVENFTKSVQNEDVCEVCQMGKQSRLPFPVNTTWRASNKLELVYTDVCGPMKTESLNGSRYFILFIDDSTRYSWIFFLKHKSEVAQVFLKFKVVAEIETGCKLKTIRSDNGAEYTSAQFQALCSDAGIKHQLIGPI
ncbi:hypothetical protein J1N35_011393 [Gossypium stocksii]|uniref:Integrase catalytic domain-containing protein n=1 Tax=Gossypium stocksii TaxID=47602 RepID=A0A9D4ADD4_9ROSI|nr:hypothetical protein J1N35_011393 [Gossypium stocksii]